MKVLVKLFATLSDYLPPNAQGNVVNLEVDEDESIGSIIERLRLPAKLVHLVLVNGIYVAPSERATQVLSDGDQLAIWPPIAGG